jgi:negative regulator of flagellin synthesis FlgM
MRIDPNAKTANLPESKSIPRSGAARTPPEEFLGNDAATLEGNARIQQLEKQVEQMPEGRPERIEALTRAVRSGTYQVDPEQVAQSLIAEMSARSVLRRL